MKKLSIIILLGAFVVGIVSVVPSVSFAKGSSYYRSAKTGRYTTKSYSNSHKSTTYKSYRK